MDSSNEKQMIQIGLHELFRRGISRYGSTNDDLYGKDEDTVKYFQMTKTIVKDPNLICEYFDDLDGYNKYLFMKACRIEGVDLYNSSDTWSDRINEMLNISNDQGSCGSSCSPYVQGDLDEYRSLIERESPLLMAALLKPDFNWSRYYSILESSICDSRYINRVWDIFLDKYMENDEQLYLKFLKRVLFENNSKPVHDIRAYLYRRFISGGYLKSTFARKMRSDGSEFASESAVSALLKNEDLYSNFDELVLSFSDSRYESVLNSLARGLPERLLPSIMGSAQRFGNVQWQLNKRFQEIEEAESVG